jgi:beta-lactam-binding protein with PASTA domain
MPNLIGEVYSEVADDKSLGIKIDLHDRVFSDEYPAGQIVWQSQNAGEQVAKGAIVAVNVSKGPEPVMPDILNMTEENARQEMQALISRADALGIELKAEYLTEYHETVEKGKIIRTIPEVSEINEKLKRPERNIKITIYVSLGMEEKTDTMINVVGDEWETAKKRLESQPLNLVVEDVQIFDSTVPAGVVVRTEPEAGAEITTGQKITVYISQGPEMKVIPDLVGSRMASAIETLGVVGFNTYKIERESNTAEKDTVIGVRINGVDVEKNQKIDVNTEITLVISNGPAAEEKPVTKEYELTLPEDRMPPYKLTIKLGEEIVFETQLPEDDEREKITLTLTGTGKQNYDAYINDSPYMKFEVDFTA